MDSQIAKGIQQLPWRPFLTTLIVFLLAGCAGSSVFVPYPATAQTYRQALETGKPETAVKAIGSKTKSADGTLYLLERARIQQLEGQTEGSKTDFAAAIARFQAQDDRATISASALATSGLSLYSNDNARPYQGRTYERVFVHQYQALNYLAQGDVTGALVEVRRANQVQVEALAKKANAVDEAREKSEREAQSKGLNAGDYDKFFSDMDLAAGRVKSGFQNAATFYLSGLIYEATGQANDAYIDYRKALEIVPDNPYLRQDAVRSGARAGMDDVQKLARQYQIPLPSRPTAADAAQGELVVYLEEGLAPVKQAVTIPVYTNRTANYVSFPVYRSVAAPQPLTLTVNGQAHQTALLTDTRALAVRTLKDEVWDLLVHSFLRLIAKQELQRNAMRSSQKSDEALLLGLATMLFTVATDQADLRSWLTLPGSAQVLRLPLAEGEHQIALPGRPGQEPIKVEVRKGKPTLLHLTVLPGSIYSRVYPL
ncbi:hypothetical protein AZ34_02805 [Hylemonella gracilis str. Niagara R]|uniref:Uncharacterized protein n=1 Tax=Hylemonella gracilis str. Niagara R TaxID=1458275 RepID=A0A016XKY9_9BURK|nr:hypothetical protein [Hylemonella gracilis]EYC52769.1 hypothetical protein AZ34_02805 [Hylemonella gracilis str. Niagara R]